MTDAPSRTTLAYFYSEIVRFRELFGQRSFWEQGAEEVRENAVRGLAVVYINLVPKSAKENDDAVIAFDVAMMEFNRRSMLAMFRGKR